MRTTLAVLLSLAALPALAHPGDHHGDLAALLWHLVSEPDHLAMMSIAIIVGAGAATSLRRRARNKNKP
jgi:hydrogenase/urease accessory protein HupE